MTCHGEHCVTCSDEGLELRVVRLDPDRGLALCVAADGQKSSVDVALVDPVAPGDALLVHAGVALAHLEPMKAT